MTKKQYLKKYIIKNVSGNCILDSSRAKELIKLQIRSNSMKTFRITIIRMFIRQSSSVNYSAVL